MADDPMFDAYEAYYNTDTYDHRYPRPNTLTLRRLLRLSGGSTLLDIGAGNGRYAIPLAAAGYRVMAVERSEAARSQLRDRADEALSASDQLTIYSEIGDICNDDLSTCSAALLLFGVLGHMAGGDYW